MIADLSRNIELMESEIDEVHRHIDKIENIRSSREQYLNSRNSDFDVFMPKANWDSEAENDYMQVYKKIRSHDREILKNLRFYSQNFTGFDIVNNINSFGTSSLKAWPRDINQVPTSISHRNTKESQTERSL